MDEILIRFIEDAKLACEESQRLCVLHCNAMAAVSRLKVEATDRGHSFDRMEAGGLIQCIIKNIMEHLHCRVVKRRKRVLKSRECHLYPSHSHSLDIIPTAQFVA